MKPRGAPLLLLALLVLSLFSGTAMSQSSTSPGIGLGFSPSSISPVSQGVPIFTQGDRLWLESYYNSTINVILFTPQGTDASGGVSVGPGQILLLHVFQTLDPSGSWILSISTANEAFLLYVTVASPDSTITPVFGGARLKGNMLNQTFSLPATDAYDIQMCTEGENIGHPFGYTLNGGSSGTAVVSLVGDNSVFTVTGTSSSLSIWLELYSRYSYEIGGGNIISQNLLVATTPVLAVSPPGANQSVPLDLQMPLREGRFDLRIFDRTSAGLSLHDTEFLRTADGAWVSLSDCTSTANAYSSAVSLATNLDSANSTWPRQLLTMYAMAGVESYTEIAVPGGEAAIHYQEFPVGLPLTGVEITPSAPGLLPSDWDTYNGSVYLLTGGLHGTVNINLAFSGIAFDTTNVSIPGPYSSKSISVEAGTIVISATQQGEPLTNATIAVGIPGSQGVAIKTNPTGSTSLLLPQGTYFVSAAYGGASSSRTVQVASGRSYTVSIDLAPQETPVTLYLLVALGVGGVIANVYFWRQYLQRRKLYG